MVKVINDQNEKDKCILIFYSRTESFKFNTCRMDRFIFYFLFKLFNIFAINS